MSSSICVHRANGTRIGPELKIEPGLISAFSQSLWVMLFHPLRVEAPGPNSFQNGSYLLSSFLTSNITGSNRAFTSIEAVETLGHMANAQIMSKPDSFIRQCLADGFGEKILSETIRPDVQERIDWFKSLRDRLFEILTTLAQNEGGKLVIC